MNRFAAGCLVGSFGMMLMSGTFLAQAGSDGRTVSAPFQVLGASGTPIFSVEEVSPGKPRLTMTSGDGGTVVIGATPSGGMAMTLSPGGGRRVALNADGQGLSVAVADGTRGILMLLDANEQSIITQDGDTRFVDIGTKASTNAAVRIANPSGTVVASLGSNRSKDGAGSVFVADNSGKTTGFLVSLPSGTGVVGIGLNGAEVARLEANANQSGGKITISDTAGNLAFNAGLKTDGNGAACVYGSDGQQCF